jgi:hypothetical protein
VTQETESGSSGSEWSGREIASLLLRSAVFIHMVGLTYALHTRAGSSIGGVALMDWGVPHATIAFHEKLWSLVLLAMATVLLVKPFAVLAFLIGVAVLLETAAAYSFGGEPFVEWSLYSGALRYGLPIALGVLLLSDRRWSSVTASWLLRVALAVVFAFHGLQALYASPRFIDLLLGTTRNFTGIDMPESAAVAMLKAIAIVDFIVAGLILVRAWPALLAWLCFWSLITALSRMTTYGVMSFPELLVRSSHIMAPLAVYALSPAWADNPFKQWFRRRPARTEATNPAANAGNVARLSITNSHE